MWYTRLPLQWLDFGGNPVTDPTVPSHPFLDIEVAKNRQGAETGWRRMRAMVDTGSSFSLVNPGILRSLEVEPVGKKRMSGTFAKAEVQFYDLCIRPVERRDFIACLEVGPLDVPLDGAECHALVGMDFLHFGKLVIETPPGESHFEINELKLRARPATTRSQSK